MNQLRADAKTIQKRFLLFIGETLKIFPAAWKMPRIEFYEKLAKELNTSYENVEHYVRNGLPLPDQSTHEVPISQEELHNAIQKIFDSIIKKRDGEEEQLISTYLQFNEYLFNIIDMCYFCIKKFEDFLPFLTADFENYLISQLVYREAWPPDEKPFTQEDRKLLKESLEKFPVKKISKEEQPNVPDEDIRAILSAIEYISHIGSQIKAVKE